MTIYRPVTIKGLKIGLYALCQYLEHLFLFLIVIKQAPEFNASNMVRIQVECKLKTRELELIYSPLLNFMLSVQNIYLFLNLTLVYIYYQYRLCF